MILAFIAISYDLQVGDFYDHYRSAAADSHPERRPFSACGFLERDERVVGSEES
jgi:hypothetical protein